MSENPIRFRIFENPDSASAQAAAEMAQLIRERATLGRCAVLGFAAGKTPLPLFEELIYLYREEGLSFRNVVCFGLVEYQGLASGHPESFQISLRRNLFDHVDIPAKNLHFLRSDVANAAVHPHCTAYEKSITKAGGIDFLILGIGRSGHIAFNEPGRAIDSRTGRVELNDWTRADAVADFGDLDEVPTHALSVGCGTLLAARKIILMAWGAKKARVVRRLIQGPITPRFTASYLRTHPSVQVFLDPPAAAVVVNTNGFDL